MSLLTTIDQRPIASAGKMWSGITASAVLHAAIAVFLVVGIPQIFQPDPPVLTVPIDIVNLDELSEQASLPAEQVGPVETAEESRPVEEVDDVARPQQATPQAVQPSPPRPATPPTTAPVPEPVVQPENAPEAVPQATEQPPATEASEPEPEPTPAEPAPAEPAPAEPAPAEQAETPPQVAAVPPADATAAPEPQPTEARETPPPPAEPAEATPEPAEAAEEQPLMTGVVPLPTPPRPADAPRPQPQPQQQAQPSPPPSPVRTQEPEEQEPSEDLLAGVLRNVDRNLKPTVQENRPETTRATGTVTQSVDLTRRAAALGQMIRGQMQRCWRIDPGARSAERLRVSVRVRLRPDGTLAAPPEFRNVGSLADSPYYRAAAESARRAILECQPFSLPQDDYELWQDLVLNFDPREMF